MQCIFVVWCLIFINFGLSSTIIVTNSVSSQSSLKSAVKVEETPVNCTPPSIDAFPPDPFTQHERRFGYVSIHFIASIYMFYCLALVCQDYFVPCIECCCDELNISGDVAGATLMAIASSSPELYTNLIATFITQGDIGVGTILGSGVFNILGVAACVGLFSKNAISLEWYPFARDGIFYTISGCLLIIFLDNRRIFWYQAVSFVLVYFVYIFVICINSTVRKWVEYNVTGLCGALNSNSAEEGLAEVIGNAILSEKTPLLEANFETGLRSDVIGDSDELLQRPELDDEHRMSTHPTYEMTNLKGIWQIITLPPKIIFKLTIPNCRNEEFRKWYLISFIMCKIWIAVLSFFISWMITVIGHTLSIPDSVMGLTFLAAGASIPDLVSSIIVARKGLASMSMGNAIGSNIFDILICLGGPWLIRASLIADDEPVNYIQINSSGLKYSVVTLLLCLFILYIVLACNRFYLDKKVGFVSLLLYFTFLIIACMFELNVFFAVNLPTCLTDS